MSERADVALHAAAVTIILAVAVYGLATGTRVAPPPTQTPTPALSASPSASVAVSSPPSVPPAATAPIASASPSPSSSRRPITPSAYAFNGHSYTGVSLGRGWTVTAPFDGTVELHVYQLVGGEIREFANASGVPAYPYVIVNAADGRKMIYRPGAVDSDTHVLVSADRKVRAGDDLFTVVGAGPSSWHDFYDQSISFQIVVSLSTAAGADADASALIKAH
ncbi:MAG: hypothetical protein KGN00_06980 [Chloroflexota bacterium]|nr:hypothetical protein [Chloroflexota bacterium]